MISLKVPHNRNFKLLLDTLQPVEGGKGNLELTSDLETADAVTIWASLFQVEMSLESESLPISTDCSKSGVLYF